MRCELAHEFYAVLLVHVECRLYRSSFYIGGVDVPSLVNLSAEHDLGFRRSVGLQFSRELHGIHHLCAAHHGSDEQHRNCQ